MQSNATSGSTIADMIHRFRTSEPSDPATRRRRRMQGRENDNADHSRVNRAERERTGQPHEQGVSAQRREGSSRFWWTESRDRDEKVRSEIARAGEFDEEEEEFDWVDSSAPLSPRVKRGGPRAKAVPSLDDLIARDVEEFANSTRLSQELRRRYERELADNEETDSDQDDQKNLRGKLTARTASETRGTRNAGRSRSVSPKRRAAYPDTSDSSEADDDATRGQNKQGRPNSNVYGGNMFDSKEAQEAVRKAKAKLVELDRKARAERSDAEEEDEQEEARERDIFSVPTPLGGKHAASSINEVASRIDMDLFSLKMSSDRLGGGDPKPHAIPGSQNDQAKESASSDDQVSSIKPSDAVAATLSEAQSQIRAIAAKARERGMAIEEALNQPPRELTYDFDAQSTESSEYMSESDDDLYLNEQNYSNIVGPAIRSRQQQRIHDNTLSRHRPLRPSKSLYGPSLRARSSEIPEQLDIALLCLERRLDKNYPLDRKQGDSGNSTSIENLKQAVTERIRDLTVSEDQEALLPPLPNDYDASLDLLASRLRASNQVAKAVPRTIVSENFDPDRFAPKYRALYNAFHARDWDEDGLIPVRDARLIITELSSWAGQPLNISDEDVLIASGLFVNGPHASKHVCFRDLADAYDAISGTSPMINSSVEERTVFPAQQPQVNAVERQNSADGDQDHSSCCSASEIDSETSSVSMKSSSETKPPTWQHKKDKSASDHQRVYADEIRRLAEELRRADTLLHESRQRSPELSSNHQSEPQHQQHHQEQSTQREDNEYNAENWQRGRPPPYNPQKVYFPSAPKPHGSGVGDVYLGEDQVILHRSQLQAAVQTATIDYYKRRSIAQASNYDISPQTKSNVGLQNDPRPLCGSQLREPLPANLEPAAQQEALDEQADPAYGDQHIGFEYHEDQGVSRLRVGGISSDPVDKGHQAATQPSSSAKQASELRGPRTHFGLHRQTLDNAWSHLSEYEALRRRLTRKVAF